MGLRGIGIHGCRLEVRPGSVYLEVSAALPTKALPTAILHA